MTQRHEQFDLVVIGSGAGGAPVATLLAEAGARVLILEKGPYYTLRDFTHDEIAICRRDFFVPWAVDDPHVVRKGAGGKSEMTRDGWTSQCVGGGTVHMSGFWYRLHEEDLRLATLTGGIPGADLADWPISLAELTPFYELAEARIGVSGQAGLNPFEPPRGPFALPPLAPHPAAALIDEAARSLGLHPFPTARALLSEPYGVRPPCNYCGMCGEYGCENGSKSSVLASLLPRAEATGRLEIRAECMARRIVTNGQRATGVEYLDREGTTQFVEARVVVLAASAIESARLLLLSESSQFPHGLANGSGLVGRNLTFSTFGKGTGIFERRALRERLGPENQDLPFLLRSLQDFYWVPKAGLPLPKGGTHNFLFHHPNPINAAMRLIGDADHELLGDALKERMRQYFQEELWIEFEVFGEFLANPGTYVDLDPTITDRRGLPAARITLEHHPADVETNKFLVRKGLEVLEAVRPAAKQVEPWTWGSTTYHLQHGTCRFGRDPASSVLDPTCRAHEVDNLYVTDASFMPTSGGVPATPTILANSFRVGRALAERFRRREID